MKTDITVDDYVFVIIFASEETSPEGLPVRVSWGGRPADSVSVLSMSGVGLFDFAHVGKVRPAATFHDVSLTSVIPMMVEQTPVATIPIENWPKILCLLLDLKVDERGPAEILATVREAIEGHPEKAEKLNAMFHNILEKRIAKQGNVGKEGHHGG